MKLPPVLSSRHKEAIFLMKRMLCVLLTLLLCAASAQADAVLDTVDYDNAAEISTKSQDGLYLYVVLEDGTAGITGYLGDETALVIPSVLDDLPVTAIGAYAFEYAALTSIVIPEGVTVIDRKAFAAASALKEITLPSTLWEIGEEAFIGCALEKVTLPEGVETLGERAFACCGQLKTITLPNTLRRMGYGVFAECDALWGLTLPASLTEIDGNPIPAIPLSKHFFANSLRIAPDNPVLRIENQMLLAGDTVICAARDVRDVTVPEGITTIGRGAFYAAQVEKVTLPEGLMEIQQEAFYDCFALRSISLPESLQSIGASAFGSCRALAEITLPEGLRTIGTRAFDWTGLTSLHLPENLKEIGYSAFASNAKLQEVTLPKNLRVIPTDMLYNCSALEKVVLPEQLERIEASAFAYCEALTEIDLPEGVQFLGRNAFERCGFASICIPDSVTEIEGNPFKNCKALRTVELSPNHPLLTVQDGMLIDHVHQRVLRRLTTGAVCIVPEGIKEIADGAFGRIPELTEITLPGSLKRIGEAAFIYCGMREITIPKGVAELERAAFLHCDQLETVHLQEGLRVIGWDAFWECSKLTDIQLPKTLEQIGLRAFEHCTSLKQLTIPASITTLYADFVDDGTELLVERGSPMEEWLQEEGYAYTMVEVE